MSLQTRLLVILAAALAPVLAVQLYNQAELRRERETQVADNARREAELIHASVARALDGGQQIARLLSGDPDIRLRRPTCRDDLDEALTAEPRFSAIALFDEAGEPWCGTEHAASLEGRRGLARDAMASGQLRLGVFTDAPPLGRHLPVAYPMADPQAGTASGALVASFDLDWLGWFLTTLEHPPGRTIVIADREATILSRYPEHDRWSGEPFLPSVAPLVRERSPGQAIIPSFDDLDRLIGYIPPSEPPGGLWSSVGYVMRDLTVGIDRAATRGYALMAASAAAAVGLALLTGHYVIRRPTRTLLAAIERAKRGDLTTPPAASFSPRSEFGALAEAYGELAAALRERQAQTDLLMEELNHRVRNTVATASGLVRGMARDQESVAAFRDDVVDRLQALARIQTLGAGPGAEAGTVARLLETELEPHAEAGAADRIRLGGPEVALDEDRVRALGLALHELATNAAKYGGLSSPRGRLDVRWEIAAGDPPVLRLVWRETGAAAPEPNREGFGTRLVRMMVEGQLRGRIDRRFDADGFVAVIEAPLPPAAAPV